MQFIDLAAQQKRIRPQIEAGFKKILDHGQYILGPEIRELEEKLAAFVGAPYAISVASGTDALLMPLMVEKIGPGDAVFTSTFTFIATAEVIELLGATAVFVDIDNETYNIDPLKLEAAIVKTISENKLKPRGIIPVDLFGQPADYQAIQTIADKYNLFWRTPPRVSAPVKMAKKPAHWPKSPPPVFSRPSHWVVTVTAA
jgi:UDP-2-acetamido-2-deoxy-ribo-hexuluronate aminotransferase